MRSKPFSIIIIMMFCSILAGFMAGCGKADNDHHSDDETGSVAVNLIWPEAEFAKHTKATPTVDCTGKGIEKIRVEFYDDPETFRITEEFPCTDGEGLVGGIPVGEDRTCLVSGENSNGTIIYQGESHVTINTGANDPVFVQMERLNNAAPTVSIETPDDNTEFVLGENVAFTGSADDAEDGALSGDSLVWTSDQSGDIGTGVTFQRSDLPTGTHHITLTATDSDGGVAAAGITIIIDNPTPFWILSTSPSDGDSDVRIDTDIEIVFNMAINPDTITGTNISVGQVLYDFTSSWNSGTMILTLSPVRDLPAQSDVVVELPGTVTGFHHEVFTGDRSFSFRTGLEWHDGNTIFVSPQGVEGNAGTKNSPLLSIQDGVTAAYTKGYTQVYVQNGTYSYSNGGLEPSATAGLLITQPITIMGGWNSSFTAYSGDNSVLDGEDNCDHVVMIQSSDVDLQYLDITGGYADGVSSPHYHGGGILFFNTVKQGNISIQNTDIYSNNAESHGGGVYLDNNTSNVTFTDCDISYNTAPELCGAGISSSYSTYLSLDNVSVSYNSSEGISSLYSHNLSIINSVFRGNGTRAIYLWGGSNIEISSNYISSDDVGIYLNSNSNTDDPFPGLSITNCTFASSTYNSGSATPIREGQSDVHDHALTNNRFLPNYLGNLYRDWDGTVISDDTAGLAIINTAGHSSHDANPASGNSLSY